MVVTIVAVSAGELHNNVRMTWGKMLLPWVSSPEGALKMAVHLNHKFALDGCNPCSYSGILWCFGQFDAPKGEFPLPDCPCCILQVKACRLYLQPLSCCGPANFWAAACCTLEKPYVICVP